MSEFTIRIAALIRRAAMDPSVRRAALDLGAAIFRAVLNGDHKRVRALLRRLGR